MDLTFVKKTLVCLYDNEWVVVGIYYSRIEHKFHNIRSAFWTIRANKALFSKTRYAPIQESMLQCKCQVHR